MTLKSQVDADIKTALLAGERDRAVILRGIKAVILDEEVATGQREAGLDDAAVEQLLLREVKKRRESAKIYQDNSRPDLALIEEQELAIIESYLPDQLDEAALREQVALAIQQTGASDLKSMGQVIGVVKAQHGAAVDGALLAKIAKEALG